MRHFIITAVGVIALTSVAQANWSDNFDSYAPGSALTGQGGWELWYAGGNDGYVSDEQAASPTNSLKNYTLSDMVQDFTGIDDGQWTMRCKVYVPSTATGDGYVIMMNQYGAPAIDNWSLQVKFDGTANIVESQWGYQQLPLIEDQWVELQADIDLDNDLLDIYYGGNPLALGLIWTNNAGSGGITSIACIDLFSNAMNGIYYDDVSLTPEPGSLALVLLGALALLRRR